MPEDPRGRQIRGRIEYPRTGRDYKEGPNTRPYACDARIFNGLWRQGKRLEDASVNGHQ